MSSEDIRKLAFSSGLSLGRPSAVPEGSEPPSELLVLRLGVTEFTRGGRAGSFEVTAEDAMRILAEASGRGRFRVGPLQWQAEKTGYAWEKAMASGWGAGRRRRSLCRTSRRAWSGRMPGSGVLFMLKPMKLTETRRKCAPSAFYSHAF